MKNHLGLIAAVGLALSTLHPPLSTVWAQGTAFSYEGQLNNNGSPANGIYDIRAGLYLTNTGGTVFAGPITNSAVAVSNGLFRITLDYGNVFDGSTYWLQVAVRSNAVGGFTVLSPRQELTPTPYAIYAEGANAAGLSGTIPPGSLAGGYSSVVNLTNPADSFVGNGAGLTKVNAARLGGLDASQFWQLSGNGGTTPGANFVGTTDNQPLDLYANNVRALRLVLRTDSEGIYSNAPNVIGGSSLNSASASYVGETVGGGGGNMGTNSLLNSVTGDFGTISGGAANLVAADFATISGGYGNISSFPGTTVGGGYQNIADSTYSTVSGGFGNSASAYQSTTAGGSGNNAGGTASTVSGGFDNVAGGYYATVPGGNANSAGGYASFAAGQYAKTTHDNSFIWGDGSQNPFNGANADNAFNVLASGGLFFYNGTNGLHVDGLGNNDGTIDFALKFGGAISSGEGIASKRTAGGNQYGLDFYTASANRMSIDKNGFVGINTTTPSTRLEVNGEFMMVDGKSGVQAYLGDDGIANDVQVGSLKSGVTSVSFWNEADGAYMHLACSSITIHGGADVAEPFPITAAANEVPPGAVVIIDAENPGHLKLSQHAYDSRVAGVVSGANGVNPGIQMQQQGLLEGGRNVALTGRVYVQADTSNGLIQPGDLLTTSSRPGRAMKVTDHARAQGAILGKAMTGLRQDKGMVLVLVSLQ